MIIFEVEKDLQLQYYLIRGTSLSFIRISFSVKVSRVVLLLFHNSKIDFGIQSPPVLKITMEQKSK